MSPAPAETISPRGARALVLGLGRFGGGLGVARWLLAEGARVCVTDRLPRADLAAAADELERAGAELVLGGHEGLDPADFDLVVVNPAVPQSAPLVRAARQAGTRVTSEMSLLLERWPGPVLGITGSNGKSTTVSLTEALLKAAGCPVRAGGNLGGSLLPELAGLAPGTVAVLELSSFRLEVSGALGLGPDVAVITNITPNHLDRHGNMASYREAKAQVLVRARVAVLPPDAELGGPLDLPPGCAPLRFGPAGAGIDLGLDVSGHLTDAGGSRRLSTSALALPGHSARLDLAAALLAAGALIGDPAAIDAALPQALAAWRPLRHRFERLARLDGVTWVDDSASTTPESTAASLAAVEGPCLLIVGGRDKGLSPEPLLAAAAKRCRLVLALGEQGPDLAAALGERGVEAEDVGTLELAVGRAAALAAPGDTVLLSPGYSSHDQFPHFEARAEAFRRLVRVLAADGSAPLSPPAAEC